MRHAVRLIVACAIVSSAFPLFGSDAPLRGTVHEDLVSVQSRAEEIFASAEAAIYFPASGRVRWLTTSGPVAAGKKAASRTPDEFIAELERDFPQFEANAQGEYLLKRPAGGMAVAVTAPAMPSATIFTDSFESGMSNWTVSNNTLDLYSWGATTCEARSGSYSADAMRGGVNTLACSDTYAANVTTAMVHKSCEAIQGASQAWLDAYIRLGADSGGDKLGFYYADASGQAYGYELSGTATAWFHLAFNLKQWYRAGDLTTASCPRLVIQFYSNATTQSGIGARIDDLTISTTAPSFLNATITAAPASGSVPLAVNFTSTVSGATSAATYQWSFGDPAGTTATTPNASITYATAGDYWPRLVVTDSGVRAFAQTLVRATTAQTCSVACTATAPATAAVGTPALFQATATPTGCSGTASYSWTFGEGGSSSAQNASHSFSSAGTYNWSLAASIAGTTCTKSGSITVIASAPARRRAVAPPPGTEQLAAATVGSAGGTLSGGGFSLSVPAGAFSSDTTLKLLRKSRAASGDLSDTYSVDGLPQALAADLTINVDLSSVPTVAAGEAVFLSFSGLALSEGAVVKSVPFFLPATASGRTVTATLPKAWGSPLLAEAAADKVSALERGRYDSRYDSKVVKMAVRTNEHFTVTANAADAGWAAAALTMLEEAHQRLLALGFNWGCRQPAGGAFVKVPVYVQSLGTAEKNAYGEHQSRLDPCGTGVVFTDFIYLNRDFDVTSTEIRAAIGHELFHAVQEVYVPTLLLDPARSLWLKEASSTWFETIFVPGPCPGVMSGGFPFAWRGLFNPNGTAAGGATTNERLQNHGYGAAVLIKYRTDSSPALNDPFVNSIWNNLKGGNSELEAVQNALGSSVPELWTKFARDYFSGTAGCSTYQNFAKSAEIKDASALPKSFKFSAYPLSAISHGFDFKTASMAAYAPLRVTAEGLADGQTVFVYSTKAKTVLAQLTKSASGATISDFDRVKGGYIVTIFVDANLPAGSAASTNEVTVSVTPAVSAYVVTAPFDDSKCHIVAWANGTRVWVPVDLFIAQWNGNSFDYTASESESDSYGTTFVSEETIRGAVSPDKKTLNSFAVEFHSTQTFPASASCPGSCLYETWASVAFDAVPAAGDWTPLMLHYKLEGPAVRARITKYEWRVRTAGWKSSTDNWDCTLQIGEGAYLDAKIEVVLY